MRYLTLFLLAITMSFMSCEAPAKKDKKNAEEETGTPSTSGSSYGVSYPAPIQEYAHNYCSCYADAAKKAAETIELSIDHQEKLSSGDISCDEKDRLEEEIRTMQREVETAQNDAMDKFVQWLTSGESIEEKVAGSLDRYGENVAPEICPQVFFNLYLVEKVETNYRRYDCDRYPGGSDDASPADANEASSSASDKGYYRENSRTKSAEAAADAGYDYDYDDYYEYEGGAESDDYEYDWQ